MSKSPSALRYIFKVYATVRYCQYFSLQALLIAYTKDVLPKLKSHPEIKRKSLEGKRRLSGRTRASALKGKEWI
jgi:hypothetical protein